MGTVKSINELEDRFVKAPASTSLTYTLNASVDTTLEELQLPTELTAMVERTSTVTIPVEDEVVDSGNGDEATPPEDKTKEKDLAEDGGSVSGDVATPSDATEGENNVDTPRPQWMQRTRLQP